ncbi:late control protein D, partial [Enterobacter hormaechei subsp. steigerwaltii]
YTQPVKATADQQAKAKKTQARRNEQKMTVTGPCRPRHIPLTAESGISTSGFGEREDRARVVESLVFSLTPAGFSFTYNLVVDIRKPAKSSKNSGSKDKTGPDYFG